MYVYLVHAWCPLKPKEGMGSPGNSYKMVANCYVGARNLPRG